MSLLAPVVDAVAYLHHQAVPIVHRDIKPANIIVPEGGMGRPCWSILISRKSIILTHVQQNEAVIHGDFEGQQRKSSFTGVLDTSKHLLFTVVGHAGQAPLFFEGSVRGDGNLVGNYCRQDQSGQCVGDYGIWSVAP